MTEKLKGVPTRAFHYNFETGKATYQVLTAVLIQQVIQQEAKRDLAL